MFQKAVRSGIKFTTEYQVTDTYIVSVPTPYDKFSKKVDAVYVVAAVKDVLKVAPKGATLVIESTVSPGTIEKSVRPVLEAEERTDINLFTPLSALSPVTWSMSSCITTAPLVLIARRLVKR